METQKLITILNLFSLCVNVGVGIFGISVLRNARRLNKTFEKYINEYKNRHNL